MSKGRVRKSTQRKPSSTANILFRRGGPTMIPTGPQCFVCDEVITGKGVPLLMGCTPYSNTGLPTKIGQLMGESFMVIVAVSDMLCKGCSLLVNQLDRLEMNIKRVKKKLINYLKVKYKLEDDYDFDAKHPYEEVEDFNGYISGQDNGGDETIVKDRSFPQLPASRDIKPTVSELKSQLLRMDEIKLEKRSPITEVNSIIEDASVDEQNYCISKEQENGQSDEVYECTSCSFTATDLESFTSHLKSHSKKIYYKCSECCQKFESQEEVEAHVLRGHGVPQVKYELNNEKISDSIFLSSAVKMYECNICKFRHHDKKVFDTHVHKHVKQEYFSCEICSRKFKHKITLKKHMNTHRTYKCGLCSVSFQNKASLVHHFQVHEHSENLVKHNVELENANSKVIGLEVVETTESEEQLALKEVKIEVGKSRGSEVPENSPDLSKEAVYDQVEVLLEKMHSEEVTVSTEVEMSQEQAESPKKEKNIKEENSIFEPEIIFGSLTTSDVIEEVELAHNNEVKDYLEDSNNYMDDSQSDVEQDNTFIKREDLNKNGQLFTVLEDGTLVLEETVKMDLTFANGGGEEEEEEATTTTEDLGGSANDQQENLNYHEEDVKVYYKDMDEVVVTSSKTQATETPAVRRKVYVCSLCSLRTPSEAHMKRHFKCHIALERKIYTCQICERVLTTHSNLKRHLALHDRCMSGEVECKVCLKVLTDSLTLKHHMEVEHLLSHQCSFCDQRFETKKLCQEHEMTHPTLPCDMCTKQFLTEGRLKNHRELMHGDPNHPISNDKTYKCHICSKFLTTYHNLKRHLRNHERCSGAVTCSLCSEELADRLHLRQHVEEKHPESFQCPFCHKVFSNKRSCKAHELSHPERFVHKCEKCERVFLTEARLKRHKDVMHRDPHCRFCAKEISNPLKLLDHERRHERHKEKFPCDQCTKIFRTPSGLKYHMSVHTGKYAVYCEICGKGLHSEVVLEEHKATHTKEVRYMCELCGRKFSSNSTYRMHRLWHDNPLPYKCNICDRKFKHTSILAVHKRRAHTGERPYKCHYCSLTFSVSSTLNKHIILHTKQYPFRCEQCNKGFTTRTKIARHMAKVHNDFQMLNAQKKKCEYKMVLMPSELPEAPVQEETVQPMVSLPDIKGEDEAHTATLQVLQLQEVSVDPNQPTIFHIFQPDLQLHETQL